MKHILKEVFGSNARKWSVFPFWILPFLVSTAAARRAAVVKMSRSLCITHCVCHITSSWPLIGQKWECYIVNEVIEADELDKGNIFAAAGKQDEL